MKKIDWRFILIVIITIVDAIYQLDPGIIDIIPDAAPVVGQIDDTIALLINVIAAWKLVAGKYKK